MHEFNTMDLELKRHSDFICKKIKELTAKHPESDASQELVTLLFQANELLEQCHDHLSMRMNTESREHEAVLADAREMEQSMVEFEEKFLKFNVPRHGDSMSFKEYEEKLRGFMEIWKKETEKGRKTGQRSLVELLQELEEERASTFEEMKEVAIDLGTYISRFLDLYFWILAYRYEMETVMGSIGEVEAALQCLTVEGKSIFLDGFLAVLKLTKFMMSLETVRQVYNKMEKVDRRRHSEKVEKENLRMVLREILRLEVAFRCPDLPMMLTDEVLLSMGNHLKNVFGKKLNQVGMEMEMLDKNKQPIDDQDEEMLHHAAEHVDSKIIEIWKNLKLNPGGYSTSS